MFDHPERLEFNPKDCEHKRRYGNSKVGTANTEHTHISLTPQSEIPKPWRQYLDCRQCKRSIAETLGWVYLHTAKDHLKDGQVLVLAGCFSGESQGDAWVITGDGTLLHTTSRYTSNSDMRVWRHATQAQHERILVCSPDTDVYNIGLVMTKPNKHYLVQINVPHANPKYVDIKKLLLAFQHDRDLASLPQTQLGSIMLQLYIVTGCDYISYVSGMGKATFLNIHADFIAGMQWDGCLCQTDQSTIKSGFNSCIRLLGTAYFKKNLATMVSKLGFETPEQLYNSMKADMSIEEKHRE